MILDGLAKLHKSNLVRRATVEEAAEIVVKLSGSGQGVATSALLGKGESIADLAPVLCLLLYDDWIDISKNGDRVCLLTEAREKLGSFLIRGPAFLRP